MTTPNHCTGPVPAKILIVGEAWGAAEAKYKLPFMGDSGWLLNEPLRAAGLSRRDVAVTNIIHEQPPRNDMRFYFTSDAPELWGLRPSPKIVEALGRLKAEIALFQPEVIVALGNYAAWALTDFMDITKTKGFGWDFKQTASQPAPAGIIKRRGSQLRLRPELEFRNDGTRTCVLITVHPAAVLRQYTLKPLLVQDFCRAARGRWEDPVYGFVVAPSFSDVMEAIEVCSKTQTLAVDLETIPDWPTIDCVGLAWSDRDAICIPFLNQWAKPYWSPDQELAIKQALRNLVVSHPNIVGQNFLYDQAYLLRELGAFFYAAHDTMVVEHLLRPDYPKGLDVLSAEYCRFHRYWKDEGKGGEGKRDVQALWRYNCIDCAVLPEIKQHQLAEIASRDWQDKLDERMAAYRGAFEIMNAGFKIDLEVRDTLIAQTTKAIDRRIEWLAWMLPAELFTSGGEPWWNSPQKQMHLFYDKLGLVPVVKPGTKRRTIDKQAITTLKTRYPALKDIFETLEELHSLKISLQVLERKLDIDNRLRYSVNLARAKTFRWSTGIHPFKIGCNMQNVSKGNEEVEWDEDEDEDLDES